MKNASKGFALTIDAVFALLMIFTVIVFISSFTFEPKTPSGASLRLMSMDMLNVMEKQGRIGAVIGGNTTSIREAFNVPDSNICMRLDIISAHTNLSVVRQDCNGYESQLQVASRLYTNNGVIYVARITSWLKN